jgi:hypothetical protein
MTNTNTEREIQKILKYRQKMSLMTGGGNSSQKSVYEYKINEHTDRLVQQGYNRNAIERVLQGGNIESDVSGILNELNKTLGNLGAVTKRVDDVNSHIDDLKREVDLTNKLVKEELRGFNDRTYAQTMILENKLLNTPINMNDVESAMEPINSLNQNLTNTVSGSITAQPNTFIGGGKKSKSKSKSKRFI